MESEYFNSHPHKEDDRCYRSKLIINDISTHILTRRMTLIATVSGLIASISTHILTRRMTGLTDRKAMYMTFQLTSSQGG